MLQPEIFGIDEFGKNSRKKVIIHQREYHKPEAGLFLNLLERWGMVAAIPDGEDASGRQKLRLMTPEELIQRAQEVTKLATKAVEDNQWSYQVPTYEELTKHIDLEKE